MTDCTTKTYQMKKEILRFPEKISKNCPRDVQKFSANMIYGLLAAESCLLSDISDKLGEGIRKKNTIDRLSRHLSEGVSEQSVRNYSIDEKQQTPDKSVFKGTFREIEGLCFCKRRNLRSAQVILSACRRKRRFCF